MDHSASHESNLGVAVARVAEDIQPEVAHGNETCHEARKESRADR